MGTHRASARMSEAPASKQDTRLAGVPGGSRTVAHALEALAVVLRKHPQVWILTDDMYEHLVFDGFQFWTIAQVEVDLLKLQRELQ